MAKLHVLIGLPASGKSTSTADLSVYGDIVVISSDALRQELLSDVNDQSNNELVFKEFYKRAEENLNKGIDVVLDATNISIKTRKVIFERFRKKADEIIAHYFNTPYNVCLYRNSLREREVPKHVIDRMYKSLQIPTYSEGWDEIEFHNVEHLSHVFDMYRYIPEIEENISKPQTYENLMSGNIDLIGDYAFKKIYELPQDTPYHTFSVSRHTYYVWKAVLDNYLGEDKLKMLWAALYHDTGKAFCKNFKTYEDGSISRYANFIGHENVSAQIAAYNLSFAYQTDFVLDVVEIVQNHMKLLQVNGSEKAEKKLLKQVGPEVFEELKFFRDCDTSAK